MRFVWYSRLVVLCFITVLIVLFTIFGQDGTAKVSNDGKPVLYSSPVTKMRQTPLELLSFEVAENGLDCGDVLRASNKCAFVKQYCGEDNVGFFNYLELYYCAFADAKFIAFVIIALTLIAVFTTIGITASDFLCPNLGTISDLLGMSESLAGVTFLALGNGSPDVFSTYAAMKSGSGSLAVGELIGAASFITSVVAGSMAIICPFTVAYGSFLRDLTFFTVAVAFAMYCLQDGRIMRWECIAMVALYLVYVAFVVTWHWFLTRYDKTQHEMPPSLQHSSSDSSVESLNPPSYYSDVVNSAGFDQDDAETAPLLGTVSHTPSSIDIKHAVERYQFRALQEGRYGEITQAMKLQRPWHNDQGGYGYGESPNLASSVPIRPSLIGALELRSAVRRGLRTLDNDLGFRHGRSASQGIPSRPVDDSYNPPKSRSHYHRHTRSHSQRHAHRFSVDRTLEYAPLSIAARFQQENRGHKFRSHSATDIEDLAYYSEGSRAPSRTSSIVSDQSQGGQSHAQSSYQARRDVPQLLLPDSIKPTPLQSPTLSLASQSSAYPVRQSSLASSVAGRKRSDSTNTASSSRTVSHQTRTGRTQHMRNKSSLSRQPRSPSPYDRFLAFQPTTLPVQPEIPQGASTLQEHDLISLHDADSHTAETLSSMSPTSNYLQLPMDDHNEESYSEISDLTSTNSFGSTAAPWPFCCFLRPYDLTKTLMPTIDRLHEKTPLNKFISIIAVPSVFLLTITIPVIEVERIESELVSVEPDVPELQLESDGTMFHDHPVEHAGTLSKTDDPFVVGQTRFKGWNKWLTCVQCICAPMSVLLVNWYDSENLLNHSMIVMLGSLFALLGIMYFTDAHHPPVKLLPIMCFVGFLVSISWISAIAVEAVGILKAYGVIFGISDAILGLTVFALGNSLGDFVSNITVAKMGYPMMAISACFGSPMLNILIGIGTSGILLLPRNAGLADDGYELEIATSLIISAATLFVTLLLFLTCVPLNGWRMTRGIGITSVSIWVIGTAINVGLEIMHNTS
ncbi:Sodium/calcium exchanger protein-domain-containing protein [Lipomyces arxii]|uniref:Sodium/calcium exchanger protein-domain-containing protein n=1 Tax=Lipomyces arxii TaxID=56418 RepID=UPI0034CE7822